MSLPDSKNGTKNGSARRWLPVADLILKVAVIIVMPFCIWIGREIIDLQKWRAATTANRFTSADGQRVYAEIAAIHKEIAALPKEVPPAWFLEEVRSLKATLDRQDVQLHSIATKVATIEAKVQ